MKVKNQLLTLKAYEPGKSVEELKDSYGLTEIVKLNSNENPYGYSQQVADALKEAVEGFSLYPDGAAVSLRKKVAASLNVKDGQLLFGAGLDEVIQIISRALLTPQSNIVMAAPTFTQYKLHAVIEGADIREVPTVNGVHDLDQMLTRIDQDTKIVWICNPNNPTGTYVNHTALKQFVENVPKETLVVFDEAYYEYVTAEDFPNSLQLLEEHANVMVLRTFSKAYGLAGFRIGYGIGDPDLMKQIQVTRLPFNANRIGQLAASAAWDDESFLTACQEHNRKGLEALYEFCEEYHVEYYPSQANFIFIKTEEINSLYEALLQRGFIVRPVPGGVRITIGKEADNLNLIAHLKEIFKGENRQQLSS